MKSIKVSKYFLFECTFWGIKCDFALLPPIHPSISMAGSSTELIMRSFICRICCCGPVLLLQSFVHIMRVGSAESQCSDVPGPFGFRVFVLWASECGQFLYLRFAVFLYFCLFLFLF